MKAFQVTLLLAAVLVAPVESLAAQLARARPGTYELIWFTQNSVTDAKVRSRVLLVLAADTLPDSLVRKMKPATRNPRTPVANRACWRLLEGELPMGGGAPTYTDWKVMPGDTIAVSLWFNIDAGTSLRLWADSSGVRGIGSSSGWMKTSSPDGRAAPRVMRDSVIGRRVSEPDPPRCAI